VKQGKPAAAGELDWYTRAGMSLLYAGIAVSMAMLFFPSGTQHLVNALVSPLVGNLLAALHTGGSSMVVVPAAKLAQSLWLAGAVCLCVQPMRVRNWSFFVTGFSIVVASVLPLIGITSAAAVLVRMLSTVAAMLWLGSLEGMSICRAILPWNWGRVWRGEMGNTALAVVGSEILTWGYALFAVSSTLGWACLAGGSGVMMKFTIAGKREGMQIAFAWYRLNYVYVITGIIQLIWAFMS